MWSPALRHKPFGPTPAEGLRPAGRRRAAGGHKGRPYNAFFHTVVSRSDPEQYSSLRSVESHVIPRKQESILPRWTPAFAGVTTAMTFIFMRRQRARVRSG